jgi:polysaccharide export outer membrane protein
MEYRVNCFCKLLFLLFLVVSSPLSAQESENGDSYRIDAGDRVYVTVFNHEDLSGEYVVDGEGRITMPLVGSLKVSGLTAEQIEDQLVGLYRPDYLVNPQISVVVRNFRPYFLIGEVRSTGSFPYVEGITYLTAIAMAGGYTYRAKKEIVFVIRGDDPEQEEVRIDVTEKVQPGDIIRVGERLF